MLRLHSSGACFPLVWSSDDQVSRSSQSLRDGCRILLMYELSYYHVVELLTAIYTVLLSAVYVSIY